MKKINKILQGRILIFDFSLVCVILGLGLYFSLQNIFSYVNLNKNKKELFVFKKTTYPTDIRKIKRSYVLLDKKFKKLLTFIERKKDLIKYLPIKTLLYIPKEIKESKITQNKKETERKTEKKATKKIVKVFHRKIKLFAYLRSIIYNPENSNLSLVYINVADSKYALEKEKYYLKENACIYIRREKLNFCIDKINANYIKVKIFTDNGDKTWTIDLYPGKRPIYLEY